MIELGRIVVKTAGRDAGKKGVVIKIIDNKTVLVDGEVRRRKVNVLHLLPLEQKVEINEEASREELKSALKPFGITIRETKPKKALGEKKGQSLQQQQVAQV